MAGAGDAVADPVAGLVQLPGVAAAVESARVAVDRMLRHGVLRRRSIEVTTESLRRGARASASLDGLAGTGDTPPIAAMRLYAELGTLLPAWSRAPRQVLARMHVLAAHGRSAGSELGRPRGGPGAEDPLGLGPAPPPGEVSGRMDGLAELVVGRRTSAPAIVVAAVVHGELLVLRPFAVGSGLVARAAARLTLVERGLDPGSLGVPEVGHAASVPAYAAAVRGYALGGGPGVAGWLVHCAGAVQAGAQEAVAICEALRRG